MRDCGASYPDGARECTFSFANTPKLQCARPRAKEMLHTGNVVLISAMALLHTGVSASPLGSSQRGARPFENFENVIQVIAIIAG